MIAAPVAVWELIGLALYLTRGSMTYVVFGTLWLLGTGAIIAVIACLMRLIPARKLPSPWKLPSPSIYNQN
jgi:hypothetical protein